MVELKFKGFLCVRNPRVHGHLQTVAGPADSDGFSSADLPRRQATGHEPLVMTVAPAVGQQPAVVADGGPNQAPAEKQGPGILVPRQSPIRFKACAL